MKKLLLNYINPNVEKTFKSSVLGLGSKLFYLILMNMFYDIGAYGFPGIISQTDEITQEMILFGLSLLLIVVTLLGIFLRKYERCLRYYSMSLILIYIIIIVEFARESCGSSKMRIFLYALSLNFLLSCVIYFNFPWIIYFIYNTILSALIMSRLFEKTDWEPENYLKFLFLIIMNGIVSYIIEKTNRESYLKLYNSNEFAQMFQTLIKDVLPTPIIIRKVRDSSICFYNQAMVQMINNEKKNEEEKINFNIFRKKENEDNLIKRIIHEKMKTLKIKEEDGCSLNFANLITILENFDQELSKEKQDLANRNKSITFLQKKMCIPKREFSDMRLIEHNLNIEQVKTEEERHFDIKIQKINWQNEESLIIIFNDITSIISLAKFKDIDIYKNRLLATVSHDLRTPINGMLGMIETVSDNIIEKRDKKLLKIAVKFGHLLLSMINDILDFSKISNFQLSLNFEQVDVLKSIKEVCSLIKFQIKNKGLEFHFEKKNIDHEHLFIKTDPNRLKQILLNLLSNALKFTFHGYIKLIIEITNENLLKISVKDTGIGIKQENIPKLFTLFGKLKQDDPNINKQGVGLGLVISQNLAKLLFDSENNGIHVESTWEEGSEFWFYLCNSNDIEYEEMSFPEILDHVNPLMSLSIRNNNEIMAFKSLKDISFPFLDNKNNTKRNPFIKNSTILIVDDDQINLMIAKEYMNYFQLNYILANNGKEALDIIFEKIILGHSVIDAILMDCNMPIMDGFTAVQKIKEILRDHNKPLIPIIALTANVSSVDIDFCFKAGMDYYLAKPVSRKDLSKLLSSILKNELPY